MQTYGFVTETILCAILRRAGISLKSYAAECPAISQTDASLLIHEGKLYLLSFLGGSELAQHIMPRSVQQLPRLMETY